MYFTLRFTKNCVSLSFRLLNCTWKPSEVNPSSPTRLCSLFCNPTAPTSYGMCQELSKTLQSFIVPCTMYPRKLTPPPAWSAHVTPSGNRLSASFQELGRSTSSSKRTMNFAFLSIRKQIRHFIHTQLKRPQLNWMQSSLSAINHYRTSSNGKLPRYQTPASLRYTRKSQP
jgi:hypothetical protein